MVSTLLVSVSSYPRPQAPTGPLPIPREGSYGPDNYFQYINVPAHKTFEWGYRRGNPDHNREEYLSQKDHTFKAKVSTGNDWGVLSPSFSIPAEVARWLQRTRRALFRLQPRPGLRSCPPQGSVLRSPWASLGAGASYSGDPSRVQSLAQTPV